MRNEASEGKLKNISLLIDEQKLTICNVYLVNYLLYPQKDGLLQHDQGPC